MKNPVHSVLVAIHIVIIALTLNGCSGGPSGDAWRYDPGVPGQVTGLTAEPGSGLVSLSWTGVSSAKSYNVYYVSSLTESGVNKKNAIVVNTPSSKIKIDGLDNNITYYFMVTAVNRDGEGAESSQVFATPSPPSNADLVGTWYFHTLVSGAGARWERGTITVDNACAVTVSDFLDSAGNTLPPAGFNLSVNQDGLVTQSGAGIWSNFHGTMGSRKNMMVASWSPSATSCAVTIFQKKRAASDYTIEDISGTGSGQNPYNPYIQGNGPTRFAYHQLYSGSGTDWEYGNGKIGQHGNMWLEQYKDAIYWDYSTPDYKIATGYEFLSKATSFGIDQDGLITEYWNYNNVVNPVTCPSFNNLVPRTPHEVVFTGRMTADKTVVVGVATRTDAYGANPQYFLRIMQLCFIPVDEALPVYTMNDLGGSYKFHKLSSSSGSPHWAYGVMSITGSGVTSFPYYTDSVSGSISYGDTFTLAYYSDPGTKAYSDFANFVSPNVAGGAASRYYSGGGAIHTYYDFYTTGTDVSNPATWTVKAMSSNYYNEHCSLSFYKDLIVMTRNDSSGNSLIIGLK
ncbi:MAG: fibronectin type III domain-containing protein [Geobacteraceae bacterium]|nr:fibronectin type III domain-containing protein [Geobacteraceae bacterium]